MWVLVAPDSFKESLSAADAADAMVAGVRDAWPDADVVRLPLADGGEGFTETVAEAWEAAGARVEWLGARVTGPLTTLPPTRRVLARYAVAQASTRSARSANVEGDPTLPERAPDPTLPERAQRVEGSRAVLEAATVVGLGLVPPELRDPLRSHTRGVGELLSAALDEGARDIVLGIGGTLTVDGGAGLLVALGARLLDADGRDVPPEPAELPRVARIDLTGLDQRLAETRLRVACDVTNPLLGARGAARVFGPQKGADATAVDALEAALTHVADLLDPDATLRDEPGTGAAGGLGFALRLLGAEPVPGAELVADLLGLDHHIARADIVLTGEGSLDDQTLDGKGPGLVAARAAAAGVPVIGFAGRLGDGHEALRGRGFTALVAITPDGTPRDEALRHAGANLRAAVAATLPRTVLLRRYRDADAAATLEVFRRAVRGTAARDYDPEQIAAWAPDTTDEAAWAARRASAHTLVATLDGRVVGFGDLREPAADEPHALLDMLFVHPDAGGQGVARALVTAALAEARRRGHARVVTHGSRTARPAFERLGFVVDDVRDPNWVRGVNVPNYDLHIDL